MLVKFFQTNRKTNELEPKDSFDFSEQEIKAMLLAETVCLPDYPSEYKIKEVKFIANDRPNYEVILENK
ncbi:MAG TPA: hypothetical protein VLA13_06680 [Massilibacterium sp.]|nr:hypothetical protein [Massilibacterium sp.]